MANPQFYCAARISEFSGLQWINVDLKNRRMLIKDTIIWDSHKVFLELKPFPKKKLSRPIFITDEILEILTQREIFKINVSDYVFHVEGKPINYGTVLHNYKNAQRKSGVTYSGNHILRHEMAKLARQVGGGLDAVIAMTGHKDFKLADHYSKLDTEFQKELSEKIMRFINNKRSNQLDADNVLEFARYSSLD